MELIDGMRERYRPEMIDELGAYTQMLDELSDEESEEEIQVNNGGGNRLFVPYVPNRPANRDANTLGSHRTNTQNTQNIQNIQKWNQSVSNLLPQSPGHRRLHSDGKIVLRKSTIRHTEKLSNSHDTPVDSPSSTDLPDKPASDCEL